MQPLFYLRRWYVGADIMSSPRTEGCNFLPDFGATASFSVDCRGDLRSPVQNHPQCLPNHGESVPYLT